MANTEKFHTLYLERGADTIRASRLLARVIQVAYNACEEPER